MTFVDASLENLLFEWSFQFGNWRILILPYFCSNYVQVVFTNPPATSGPVITAFTNAANRWSSILAGTNINSVSYSSNTFNQFGCGLTNNAAIPDGSTDRLIIAADIAPIDGAGNILGSAGPCARFSASVDRPAVLLPVLGAMTFDSADLASMESAGTLEDVILHEMAHVSCNSMCEAWRAVKMMGEFAGAWNRNAVGCGAGT